MRVEIAGKPDANIELGFAVHSSRAFYGLWFIIIIIIFLLLSAWNICPIINSILKIKIWLKINFLVFMEIVEVLVLGYVHRNIDVDENFENIVKIDEN